MTMMDKTAHASRRREFHCDDLFVSRWSPRSMSGESISDDELMKLFEAARWAPSSYNGQPWRFVYAKRDTLEWKKLFELMGEFNQSWTKTAAVLIVMVSKNTFDHNNQPAKTHSFDTGSAWMSLALQGYMQGLVVHGMEGFDYAKAKTTLDIPDGFTVEAMCAIGKQGKKTDLPKEIAERETPSSRKPLKELVFKGSWRK